jgi:hypothetical protein
MTQTEIIGIASVPVEKPRRAQCDGWHQPRHGTTYPLGVLYFTGGWESKLCPSCLRDYLDDPNLSAHNRHMAECCHHIVQALYR